MSLEVAENNAAARHFYRSLGFVASGRIAEILWGEGRCRSYGEDDFVARSLVQKLPAYGDADCQHCLEGEGKNHAARAAELDLACSVNSYTSAACRETIALRTMCNSCLID